MTCRVCHAFGGDGWLGWNADGKRLRCQWCNSVGQPWSPEKPKPEPRDLRAERVAQLKREAIVGVNDSGAEWERVIMLPDEANYLERTEVPGGWLYRTMVGNDNGAWVVAMCFVPRAPTEYRSR